MLAVTETNYQVAPIGMKFSGTASIPGDFLHDDCTFEVGHEEVKCIDGYYKGEIFNSVAVRINNEENFRTMFRCFKPTNEINYITIEIKELDVKGRQFNGNPKSH